MAITLMLKSIRMLDGYTSTPSGSWSTSISTAEIKILESKNYTPLGGWSTNTKLLPLSFQDGKYQGDFLNWGGFGMGPVGSFIDTAYQGYSTNWDVIDNLIGGLSSAVVDVNSLKNLPKAHTIFYKLRGYNPVTEEYEVWVISEDITTRPETFNPGNNPPNRENSIYYTPPSGNQLNDIVIVARWLHQG